jgi:hypothetical protein
MTCSPVLCLILQTYNSFNYKLDNNMLVQAYHSVFRRLQVYTINPLH